MKRLTIEEYEEYPNVQLYTIRLNSKEFNETEEFVFRFKNNDKYKSEFNIISKWINKIGESGALERYFRSENSALAIPIEVSKLRFYCIRISDDILILGNGGVKTSKKVQDSPDCYPHFLIANEVSKKMEKAFKSGQVSIENKKLNGNLNFDIYE